MPMPDGWAGGLDDGCMTKAKLRLVRNKEV